MDILDPKQLKKLADSCRKAGISSFKGFGVEFTLGAEPQPKVYSKRRTVNHEPTIEVQGPNGPTKIAAPKTPAKDEIDTDEPTAEELLFWSVSDETQETSA